jgi:hypothetical protein
VGTITVGPSGQLAVPIDTSGSMTLGMMDAGGTLRVLAGGARMVTEAAFSPDGLRIVFHDESSDGGLFIVDSDGGRAPRRLTNDTGDAAPSWLDEERIVFHRAEDGYPFGRLYTVPVSGGAIEAVSPVPAGVLIGTVPERGSILLAEQRAGGDHFHERTRDGKIHELVFGGTPSKVAIERFTSMSPKGRYVAWFSGGDAWRGDVSTRKATRIRLPPLPGIAMTIQPDDSGALTVSYRHDEGQLYEIRGSFP